MAGNKKSSNMLLLNVPADVKEMIEDYKKRKIEDCGCRFGNSQAIYNMLRKLHSIYKAGANPQTSP